MRRFEGGKDRFWEIRIDGTTVYTRSGKIGTNGKANAPKKLASRGRAEQDVEKRIQEQRAKGFLEVTPPALKEPANAALEQQIIEEPMDAGRCLVYADWLLEQKHPRGELGVLQAQRSERPDDAALAKAETKLLETHPELAPQRVMESAKRSKRTNETDDDRSTIRWENGFIAAARLSRASDRLPYTVRELVCELLGHPAARFLRELRIGSLGPDEHDYGDVIDEIIRGCPSTLRLLSLVDLPPGTAELVFANLADVTPLLAATPLLEELRLAGQQVVVRSIALPKLRRLAIATSDETVLSVVAKATLPSLESLQLSSGDAPMPTTALAKVLAPTWTARQLAITRTANTDQLVPFVLKSTLLPTLSRLDLSGGTLSDAGAGLLLAAASKLDHLEYLDLSGNTLSLAVTKQLGRLCASVRIDNQRATTTVPISDNDLRRMSPDASALAKGRELAKPKLWPTLGRADDTYWGTHRGSDLYEVYVRVPSLQNGCSCPSGKRPCKHTIALAILVSSGHAFEARALPSGLTSRASSSRYYGSGE
jgi:uncharacterized protein (TIGR02996 family)